MTKEERTQLLIDKLNLQEQELAFPNEEVKDAATMAKDFQDRSQLPHGMTQSESKLELIHAQGNSLTQDAAKMPKAPKESNE